MGKRIIPQRRGRGSPTYTAPSHRYLGKLEYINPPKEILKGEIRDLVNSVGHSAPIMVIEYEDGQTCLIPAPIGVRVGQEVQIGDKVDIKAGNTAQLGNMPAGTVVCNIENRPGDCGQLIRTSGTSAQIISKEGKKVIIKLPSKKKVAFLSNCRATIGVVAGGGKKTKPLLKAGKKMHAMRAKNKLYPRVAGVAMNVIDHPHGGTHRRTVGRPNTIKRGTSPGKKAGLIAARKSGRGK